MQEQFIEQATRAGAVVHAAEDWAAAARLVADLLARAGLHSAVLAKDLGPARPLFAEALAAAGLAVLSPDGPAAVAGVDAGLSRVALGIAETGSVVVAGNELEDRLVTMLAPVHVALLPADALVASLDDAAAFLRRSVAAGTRYVSLVTGPSRTADIERALTIGVQGPKELHVVVVESDAVAEWESGSWRKADAEGG